MIALSRLVKTGRLSPGQTCPPLDDVGPLSQFRAWERGFDARIAGHGPERNEEHGRARPLWRDGWNAAARIEQLRSEQANTVTEL